ncbi:MAG: 3-deoxy-7-phosphoheptulonate synthase [Victivallaceae bacterium]
MLRSNNVNILNRSALLPPGELIAQLPLSFDGASKVVEARNTVNAILDGSCRKKMIIVGPCSIHDPASALEYAARLERLSAQVSDKFLLIMRAYFEKPRTTIGWKGLIYDPDINGAYDIDKGLFIARKLLLQIVDHGLPVATEMLDPIIAQYIADTVTWAAIGARTTESQTHRQLASGLSMAVGFKNATDGSFQTAIDAINTAKAEHSFIGVMENGQVGIFRTRGNKYCHLVLRGGEHPNYEAEYIAFLKVAMRKAALRPNIVVDCSHANSHKNYRLQGKVFENVIDQIVAGEEDIVGTMLESYLLEGSQKIVPGKMAPDVSITDGCIGWEETESLILSAYEKLKAAGI